MNKFIKSLLLFIIPFCLLAYLTDILISNAIKKTRLNITGEFEVWNDIYNGEIKSDIAIYGSSRAYVHFNSEIIEDSLGLSTYNFGIDGHNFWLQYLRHIEYFKYNRKPKVILLSVDIFSLTKREDLYNKNQFLPFMLWNSNVKSYTSSYKGFLFYDYVIPLLRYTGNRTAINLAIYKLIYGNNITPLRVKGFKGHDFEWSDDFDDARKKMNSYEVKFDLETIELLKKFISECNSNGIQLILIYAPEYIEGQRFVKNRVELMSIYKSISKELNIKLLDYSDHGFSYQKDLFYNSNHLNKVGANKFTSKLSSDLKLLISSD